MLAMHKAKMLYNNNMDRCQKHLSYIFMLNNIVL